MDNERFPEREEPILPIPEEPDDTLEIQELTFAPEEAVPEAPGDAPVMEDLTMPEDPGEPVFPEDVPDLAYPGEEASAGEIPEDVPLEEALFGELPPQEETPRPAPVTGAEFMSHIPDVDEDYPQEHEDFVEVPEDYAEILAGDLSDPASDVSGEALPLEDPPAEEVDQQYQDAPPPPEEAAPPKEPAPRPRPLRKGRPKRKKGEGLLGIPNILVTLVWLALIVAVGVTAGRMAWVCAADVLAFGREDKPVTITVYESDTLDDIQNKLYDAGLIRYKSLFELYASISHAEEKIKPGIYDLNTRYDYHALVNFMTPRSNREVVKVTIPEGYTCRQVFDLLEENKVCTARDIAAYAATGELDDYWFLTSVERGDQYCLEGFLFPDTYEFYKNSTPKEALQRMLNNFGNRFDEEMQGQIDSLNAYLADLMRTAGRSEDEIAAHWLSVRDVTIVASLIEKETSSAEESPTIASVIYNRLYNWGGNPAYLNIDASIIYALDGKTDLTSEDMRVDSPFNTYTHTGLTPTPISNPGLASLKAALNPASTNYYFYVLNPETGVHQFSTTADEHNAYVSQFAAARSGE